MFPVYVNILLLVVNNILSMYIYSCSKKKQGISHHRRSQRESGGLAPPMDVEKICKTVLAVQKGHI